MTRPPLLAFLDESGHRSFSARSSDCFVMAAVAYPDSCTGAATRLLASLRRDLRRNPGDELSWKNIRSHAQRLHIAKTLGEADFLVAAAVVVHKRLIPPDKRLEDEDKAYLFTYRLLLERLSWIAKRARHDLDYTLAHIIRFKRAKLDEYERILFKSAQSIEWEYVRGRAKLATPGNVEGLQFADLTASAIACAFNCDEYGHHEDRYLRLLAPTLKRDRPDGKLTTYGLKMLPWSDLVKERFKWVSEL